MYTYGEFKEAVIKQIQAEAGSGEEVCPTVVKRNNGLEKEGLLIRNKGQDLMPLIYLGDLYENYKEEGSIEPCLERIKKAITDRSLMGASEILLEWEMAKRNISVYLINREWNGNRLHDMPHKDFYDLAVVCRCIVCRGEFGIGSFDVSHKLLEYWGISQDELWENAEKNMMQEEFSIESLLSLVKNMIPELEQSELKDAQFVLTNRARQYGASGILRRDLLEKFAIERDASFFILPSSIHEMLLIPDKGFLQVEELKKMVWEVNRTQVSWDERLSDRVYYFRRETGEVECLC